MTTTTSSGTDSLIGLVLTHNEEQNLPACLESLRGVVAYTVVVDSGSQDQTVELARAHGAQVLNHRFVSHASQWRWALAQVAPEVQWVLALDADQRLTRALREEIKRLFDTNSAERDNHAGFYVNRRQIFRGRWLRHGGYYPKYLLKLFRLNAVELDERDLMDHHFYVRGRVGKLAADMIEENKKETDITFWIRKHIDYAELHAREELARRGESRPWLLNPSLFGTPDERVIWLKQLWYRLPLYVRPFLYFLLRYFIQLGFLDGKEGFLFHFLQAFWYRLLVDIKIADLREQLQQEPASSRDGLSRLHFER